VGAEDHIGIRNIGSVGYLDFRYRHNLRTYRAAGLFSGSTGIYRQAFVAMRAVKIDFHFWSPGLYWLSVLEGCEIPSAFNGTLERDLQF
jgi:hypothetical protein